jgi:glycosyltransferase involved in cell wall biosynthesis
VFVLQVALVKGRGGITTAVEEYERMCRAVGVRSACVFEGPAAEALRAQGIDVIDAPRTITSSLPLPTGLRDAIATRAEGRRVLAIVHSDMALPAIRRAAPHAIIAAPCHSDKHERKAGADLVITLNADQQTRVAAGLHRSKARVALLGNPYIASAARIDADGPARINFAARFIPTKDPMTLLSAAPLLKHKAQLRFIGAGELEAEMHEAVRQSGVAAEFPGWLSDPFADFHRGDILVLPSHWEGLPYLLQEALDRAVPIVAADNPGNRTALGDGAYGELFPVGDAAALAHALDKVLADPATARAKAEHGRTALHANYGAQAFWQKLQTEIAAIDAARG